MTPVLFFGLLACAGSKQPPAAPVATDDDVVSRLATYLQGRFNNAAQNEANPDDYYAISLRACPVVLPALGETVLYIEQAAVGQPPYRQRLYLIEQIDQTQARSRIFTLSDRKDWIGFCDRGTTVPISEGTWEERVGCSVVVTWDATQERFTGSTTGTECTTSLGGAYASSEVTITAEGVISWDRGWNEDGSQAWGASKGGYDFKRLP